MNGRNQLEVERIKNITKLIINENKNEVNPTDGYRTQDDIVNAYNKEYPKDNSLTQGKLSKLIKEKGFIQKNSHGVFVIQDEHAKYESIKRAYLKANGRLKEVREFAIEVDGNIVELLRVIERNFYGKIYDVTFDKKLLKFKALIDPQFYVNDDSIDYDDILNILIHIDGKANKKG